MATDDRERSDSGDEIIDLTAGQVDLVGWRTASTDRTVVEAGGSRWRRAAPSSRALPKGEKHAFRPGDAQTACGLSLDGLHAWTEQPYGDGLLNRCPTCLARLRSLRETART